jgi:hypothetical protein
MEAILVPICICVILPVLIVWMVMRARKHETDKKAEIMLKAIEAGVPVDMEQFSKKKTPVSLKKEMLDKFNGACIVSLLGVVFLTLGIIGRMNPGFNDFLFGSNAFMLPAGGIMMAVGIGLFISYFVSKKMLAKEIEAEEKALEEQK